MYTYEIQNRGSIEKLFILYKDDGTPDSISPIGSLYLSKDMEPLIEKLIKELNDWNSSAKSREREGIQTITGEG